MPRPVYFYPGQFISILIPEQDKILIRSYSIVNQISPTTKIQIIFSYVQHGFASEFFLQANEGDILQVRIPLGKLILSPDRIPKYKRYFLISTGTGIVPYYSMLPLLSSKAYQDCLIYIIYGCRTLDDALFRHEFCMYDHHYKHINFFSCFSRISHDNLPDDKSRIGRVLSCLSGYSFDPEQDIFYLCGNPNMVNDVHEFLAEKDIPIASIKREKYISPQRKNP